MRRFFLLFLPLALALPLIPGCQTDPVTGKSYFSPMGNDYDSQSGWIRKNQVTQSALARDGGDLPEPEIYRVCERSFQKVAAGVPQKHRRGFKYHLYLSPSPQINAYTYGGGRVHVHLGLLAACRDEAEFAGVMGHEIGHNSHDHVGKGMGRQTLSGGILAVGSIFVSEKYRKYAVTGGAAVLGVLNIQFTRAQEKESDKRAVDYTLAAGYDPDGAARFFEVLQNRHGKAIKRTPEFFSTHPYPENRVAAIRKRIAKKGGVPPGATRNTAEFAAVLPKIRRLNEHYTKLEKARGSKNHRTIVAAADESIQVYPHHSQFWFWRGVSLYEMGRRADGVSSLREADRLDRSNALIPLVLAEAELETGSAEFAEQAANKCLGIMKGIPLAHYLRGVARYRLGQRSSAFQDFDRALSGTQEKKAQSDLYRKIRTAAPDYTYRASS